MDDDTQNPETSSEPEQKASLSWYESPFVWGQLLFLYVQLMVSILMLFSLFFLMNVEDDFFGAFLLGLWLLFFGFGEFGLFTLWSISMYNKLHRRISLWHGILSILWGISCTFLAFVATLIFAIPIFDIAYERAQPAEAIQYTESRERTGQGET